MKIFVYGSLKKGKKLNYFLKNAIFKYKAKTIKKYPLILSKSKWYPYLLDIPNKGYFIEGEVYEIDYSTLKNLDRLEEVPFYYKRKKILLKANNNTINAYTYFFAKKKKFLKKELIKKF